MTQDLPFVEFSLERLTEQAIDCLRFHAPKDGSPYYGCFSGGKDSCVIKEIGRLSGVPIEWHYNVTTIDPPELVRFIKREHPDVKFNRPKKSFFVMMDTHGFPTRRVRWCCAEFKEKGTPKGARLILGIRAAESATRARRWKVATFHNRTNDYAISPILYWRDVDVWGFIREHDLPYCSLYDEGFKRLGCIGCPMAGPKGRKIEFARWPRYERLWKKGFQRIWEKRAGTKQRDGREWFGSARFDSWEEMWKWWLNDDSLPPEKCQGMKDLLF